MLNNEDIKDTLKFLDIKYNDTNELKEGALYSKLALLEYCAWLEDAMDKITLDSVYKKLQDRYKEKLNRRIEINSSFLYNDFREMLIFAIGVVKMEDIENQFLEDKTILKQKLKSYKNQRNIYAHQHTTGQTAEYDAPSKTLKELEEIYPILNKIYQLVTPPNHK